MRKFTTLFIFIVLYSFLPNTVLATSQAPEIITLDVEYDRFGKARLYSAEGLHAVVLAHQGYYTQETWHDFANDLRSRKITTLCLVHSLDSVLESAVHFLRQKGYENITLMGARTGGRIIMDAVSQTDFPKVDQIILLTPYVGTPLTQTTIRKLIFGVPFDFIGNGARQVYKQASEPKQHIEIKTGDLGENLVKGEHRAKITQIIFEFITNPP